MRADLRNGVLGLCLLLPFQTFTILAQDSSEQAPAQATPPAPPDAQQPATTPAPAPAPPPAAQAPKAQPSATQSKPATSAAAKAKAERESQPDSSDNMLTIMPFVWAVRTHPFLGKGHASAVTQPADLTFPRKEALAPGAELTIPAGPGNTVRITYFRLKTSGVTYPPKEIAPFGIDYASGTQLTADYTMQNVKISYDYICFPFPVKDAKTRYKLLFEMQYNTIQPTIDAPVLEASNNTSGQFQAKGTKWFIYPSLGGGIEHALSKHFRVEVRATGFAIPKHAVIGGGEATAAYKFGSLELMFGAKAHYFKTSPKQDQYVKMLMPGAFVGLRWYLQ